MQRGGGVQTSKKLLAALAVMAVAFVVLAVVPSVAADESATTPEFGKITVKFDGVTYQEQTGTDKEFDTMKAAMDFINVDTEHNGKAITVVCEENKPVNFGGNHDPKIMKSLAIEGNNAYVMSLANGKYVLGGNLAYNDAEASAVNSKIELVINNLDGVRVWGTPSAYDFAVTLNGCDSIEDKGAIINGDFAFGVMLRTDASIGKVNITIQNCISVPMDSVHLSTRQLPAL